MPVQNFAKDLIEAYNVGLQQKIEKAKIAEEQKRYEQDQKIKEQQLKESQRRWEADFKSRDEQFKIEEKHRQLQDEAAKLKIKLDVGSLLSSGELKYPTSAKAREMFLKGGQETPDPYTIPGLGIQINPNEVEDPQSRLKRLEAEKRATFAPTMEMQQMLMGGRLDIADINARNRREIEDLKSQNKLDVALAKLEGKANNSQVDEGSTDLLMQAALQGNLAFDKLSAKTRERLTIEATRRGIYIQPEKFKEESKKLESTAQFLQLATRILDADPRNVNEWATLAANLKGMRQQLGTLGAQFPALGRLSDNDIALLDSGLPDKMKVAIQKLLPSWGTPYNQALKANLLRSYGSQLNAHLANVPNKEEKNRLVRMYGLNFPGLSAFMPRESK